jgi:peptidoglycan/LPS O-acetylase OafA/YrhL
LTEHLVHLEGAERMGSLQWWYWTHTTNWMMALAGTEQVAPFHTSFMWSLAIEEQFYFVWPLLVGWLSRRQFLLLCLALAASSLLLRMAFVLLGAPYATVYRATVTHLDPLALGSAVAVLMRSPGGLMRFRRYAPLTLWICGVIFCVMAGMAPRTSSQHRTAFVGEVTLVALGSAALLVLALTSRPGSWPVRVLASRPLRALGFYSYAIYMFHVFVRTALERAGASPAALLAVFGGSYILLQIGWTLLGGGLAFVLALVSWHLYESHFLKLKRWMPMPHAPAPEPAPAPAPAPLSESPPHGPP